MEGEGCKLEAARLYIVYCVGTIFRKFGTNHRSLFNGSVLKRLASRVVAYLLSVDPCQW